MCPEVKFPMSKAVRNAYDQGKEDETLLPLVLVNHQNEPVGRIHAGDSVIFYNIRGEREIELTRSLTEQTFREFPIDKNIGAGRRIYSDRLNIDQAILSHDFYRNQAFINVMRMAKQNGTALHVMGIEYLFALMDMAKQQGISCLFIHGMLGRRGELPESGARYIQQVEEKCLALQLGRVVSVIGRYWSMDREENWDRIEKTYRMLVYGEGDKVSAE